MSNPSPDRPTRTRHGLIACARLVLCFAPALLPGAVIAAAPDGAALFAERCAACHDHASDRIPSTVYLATTRSPEDVIDALTRGAMQAQGTGLTAEERVALATHLTGRPPSAGGRADPMANRCSQPLEPTHVQSGDSNGWGMDRQNTRFQSQPGLTAADLPRLTLKWVFAFPGAVVYGQPALVGKQILTSGSGGYLFSLDPNSGCTHWVYNAGATLRTPSLVGSVKLPHAKHHTTQPTTRQLVWIGDDKGTLHAVDTQTGTLVWKRRLDEHLAARLLGAPTLYHGVLYQPVSSLEEVYAANPQYPCCSFRGSIVALDPATGRVLWKKTTIQEPWSDLPKNESGKVIRGPAGGSVFSSPTVDPERNLLYVGSGDSYTNVKTASTDAIIAMNATTGARVWTHQVDPNDAWIMLCNGRSVDNCPSELGPDFDFSASPILVKPTHGPQMLIAASKSGAVYGLDPAHGGKALWMRSIVKGSSNGGILWGGAVDGTTAYIGTSEYDLASGTGGGALVALDLVTGAIRWQTPTPASPCGWGPARCGHSVLAAVTATADIIFAGAMDGHIRAYAPTDGHILWEFDVSQRFDAVNGVTATGGGIDYGGQVLVQGLLLVQSGSPRQRGNALLAFSVDGQ